MRYSIRFTVPSVVSQLLLTLLIATTTASAQSTCTAETNPNEVCIGVLVGNNSCATGQMSDGNDIDAFSKVLTPGEWTVRFTNGSGRLTVTFPVANQGQSVDVGTGQSELTFSVPSTDTLTCVAVDMASTNYTIEFVGGDNSGGEGGGGDEGDDGGSGDGDGKKGGGGKKGKKKIAKHNKKVCKQIKKKLPKASDCTGKKSNLTGCSGETTLFFASGTGATNTTNYDIITPRLDVTKKGYQLRFSGRLFDPADASNNPATFFCQTSNTPRRNRRFTCRGQVVPTAGGKKTKLCCKGKYEKTGDSMEVNLNCGGRQKFTLTGDVSPYEEAFGDFDNDGDVDLLDFNIVTSCIDGLDNKKAASCPSIASLTETNTVMTEDQRFESPEGIFLPNDLSFD